MQVSISFWEVFSFYLYIQALSSFISVPQGFFGRPLRGRFSTVLLRRYFTIMLCTVDLGIFSSCPMAPSDLPSFHRSTTRCRCTTSCSLVFWQTPAAAGPPAAPPAPPPVAPAAAAASVGADKRQTVVETRRWGGRGSRIMRHFTAPRRDFSFSVPPSSAEEVGGRLPTLARVQCPGAPLHLSFFFLLLL